MMFVTAMGSMILFVLYMTFTAQVSTLAVQSDLFAVTTAKLNASLAPEASYEKTYGSDDHNDSQSPSYDRTTESTLVPDIVQRLVPGVPDTTNLYDKYAVYTDKCRIRLYDSNNKAVIKRFFKSVPTNCPRNAKPFVFVPDLNVTGGYSCIGFDVAVSRKHYGAEEKDWKCIYKEVIRGKKYEVLDKHYEYGRVESFVPGDCPRMEFLWIECHLSNRTQNYTQPLMLPLVKSVVKQIRKNNLRKTPMNVLVVGMDSVSRLNAHRQFPRTLSFLQTKKNLVELFGYNKIGLNSAPNQIPLLTGVKYSGDNLKARVTNHFFDNETRYLWDDFDSRGFRTMYYEEQWSYGLFVYPSTNGFKKVPTTYWPRPMFQAIDGSKLKKKGNDLCIGPHFPAKHYLDYTLNTLRILGSERPLFSYSWLSETAHDDLNGGKRVDGYFLDFFKKMDGEGILNHTAVFFISDHGFRFGSFRKTELGRYEDMLPYGFILLPDSYFAQYPEALTNLRANARRLVTVYDLHVSMLELADSWDEDRVVRTPNGFSLFSNIIPENRNCFEAGIDFQFCSCFEAQPYDRNSSLASHVAAFLIGKINEIVSNNSATSKCHHWELGSIDSFDQLSEGNAWTNFYKMSLKTEPAAQFEAAVELHSEENLTLLSDIDRTDWFSSHAECVKSTEYERYCYCR
ncbi:uncharacterized protein LOC100907079 [Galendromus occidentalis]|uniref:Uncharacterized protein LOC100907079 n=1 Tax=Galendromus occidentalis TaxID=34638 RepID=A0AAJ7P9H8_9ACAR|nr:uncharacterized protein LOC100907079 [Galendromus occidentalis]